MTARLVVALRRAVTVAVLAGAGSAGLAAPAHATILYGITAGTERVVTIDSKDPSNPIRDVLITGLGATEHVVGTDIRPADATLYVLTRDTSTGAGRLRTLDPATGVVGPAVDLVVSTADGEAPYGSLPSVAADVDFDPTTDLLHYVASDDTNLRISAAGLVRKQATYGYAIGDPLQGWNSQITAIAFSNNFLGAPSTEATVWDTFLNWFASVDTIGRASIWSRVKPDIAVGNQHATALDVVTSDVTDATGGLENRVFAMATTDGVQQLYLVNAAVARETGGTTHLGSLPAQMTLHHLAARGNVVRPVTVAGTGIEGGAAEVVVRREDPLGESVVEWHVVAGSAGAADVGATSGTVTFGTGATTARVSIPIADDLLDEASESFRVTFAAGPNGPKSLPLVFPESAEGTTITIADTDDPAPTPMPSTQTPVTPVTPIGPVLDTTKPFVFAFQPAALTRAAFARRGLDVAATVSERSSGSIQLTLGTVVVGTTPFSTPGAAAVTKSVRATRAGAAAITRAFRNPRVRSVRLTLVTTAADTVGNSSRTSRTVTLRR